MRLCKEDRKELVQAMRQTLLEQVDTAVLTESKGISAKNFILNEATYEQMLNLCFNENREEKYLSAAVLEGVAVKVYETYVKEGIGSFVRKPVRALGKVFARSGESARKGAVSTAQQMTRKGKGSIKARNAAIASAQDAGTRRQAAGSHLYRHAGKYTAGAGLAAYGTARHLAKKRAQQNG